MSSVFVLCNLLQKWACYACPKFWKILPECTVWGQWDHQPLRVVGLIPGCTGPINLHRFRLCQSFTPHFMDWENSAILHALKISFFASPCKLFAATSIIITQCMNVHVHWSYTKAIFRKFAGRTFAGSKKPPPTSSTWNFFTQVCRRVAALRKVGRKTTLTWRTCVKNKKKTLQFRCACCVRHPPPANVCISTRGERTLLGRPARLPLFFIRVTNSELWRATVLEKMFFFLNHESGALF